MPRGQRLTAVAAIELSMNGRTPKRFEEIIVALEEGELENAYAAIREACSMKFRDCWFTTQVMSQPYSKVVEAVASALRRDRFRVVCYGPSTLLIAW